MQSVKELCLGIAVALCAHSTFAGQLAIEEFNYGGSTVPLNGLGSAGNGFASGWTADSGWTYNPTSLSFSDLSVSGGSVSGLSPLFSKVGRRPFSATLPASTVYWGSFLSKVSSQTGNDDWTSSLYVGTGAEDPNEATFIFNPKSFSLTAASIAIEGNGAQLTGPGITTSTTYLNLFKADPAAKTITGWILTAGQYDNFKTGGIIESELNAAATGSGSANVYGRGSYTAEDEYIYDPETDEEAWVPVVLDPATTLSLLNYGTEDGSGTQSFDRIIFSSDDLNSAIMPTAVPEPSSCALLALGVAGLFGWVRRKR